ncbi:MAG: hypothetical protein ICV73_13780 [Acetobacteraceae bacterium]|nr:hypothetical protein [Acetobacteraceae bacterium]
MTRSTEPDGARVVRVRAYLGGRVRDVRRTFRAPAGADLAALMKRAALAAIPKAEGWRLVVFSIERSSEDERVAPFLDRLARHHMGGDGFAAALAATLDGARAVLAVGAKDPARIERLRAALASVGR